MGIVKVEESQADCKPPRIFAQVKNARLVKTTGEKERVKSILIKTKQTNKKKKQRLFGSLDPKRIAREARNNSRVGPRTLDNNSSYQDSNPKHIVGRGVF